MSPEPRTWSICESAAICMVRFRTHSAQRTSLKYASEQALIPSTFTPKCKQTCSALLRHSSSNGTHRAQAQVCSGMHKMHQVMPCSLFASFTFKCLAAGRHATNVLQKPSFAAAVVFRHAAHAKADNEHAAREATLLYHPLHRQNGINGTSGSDRRLRQVSNSLYLPHHSQCKI